MQNHKKIRRKAHVFQDECVACGCCEKVCPRDAIRIDRGVWAVVDLEACIGCGKCVRECPASVIKLREVNG